MKVYLSGIEKKDILRVMFDAKQKYILMSYLYLKKKKVSLKDIIDQSGYGIKIMIDGGARTFHKKGVVGVLGSADKTAVGDYIKKYADWLDKNRDYIEMGVELDIHGSPIDTDATEIERYPYEEIIEYREKIWKPLHDSGLDTCLVLHGEPMEETRKFSDYIGVSKQTTEIGSLPKVVSEAKRLNVRLHGVAVTGQEIRRFKFTSVDSTTWLDGARYGVTFKFTGSTMLFIDMHHKYRRKSFKKKCNEIDVDFEKFRADDAAEVNRFNIFQWKEYSDYLENRWEGKAKAAVPAAPDEEPGASRPPDLIKPMPAEDYTFMRCDTCYIKEGCPIAKDGSQCGFKLPKDIMSTGGISKILETVLQTQFGRVLRGKAIEEHDGGVPDKVLSNEINLLMNVITRIKELSQDDEEVLIKAKGKGGTSILAELFGSLKKEAEGPPPKDITPDKEETNEEVSKETGSD
jgi:hypothetical protein